MKVYQIGAMHGMSPTSSTKGCCFDICKRTSSFVQGEAIASCWVLAKILSFEALWPEICQTSSSDGESNC